MKNKKKNKMAKKVKEKINSKHKKEIYKTVIAGILVLVLILIAGLIYKQNSKEEQESVESKPGFLDNDLCKCIERNRLRCADGFELDVEKRACIRGADFTNVVLACSQYDCEGQVYKFNNETKEWENKTG